MLRTTAILLVLQGVSFAQPTSSEPVEPDAPAEPPPGEQPPPPAVEPSPAPAAPAPPPAVAPEPEPAPVSEAHQAAMANYAPSSIKFSGFLQSQFRQRKDVEGNVFDPDDTNGFRLARVRVIGDAATRAGNLELSAYVEVEVQPSFFMTDAFGTVSRQLPKQARVTFDLGQMRVPLSRQSLLSDVRIAFVEKAQFVSIAPDRDLGARLTVQLPRPSFGKLRLPGLKLVGGAFNGEGPNQVENINQEYLYTGRAELTLLGEERILSESSFAGAFLTASGSYGRNIRSEGDRTETIRYAGFDVAGAYRGLSGTFEYFQARHDQRQASGMDDPNTPDFRANGFTLQANYLLPLKLAPYRQGRLELGMRVEEIDRNDTVPIVVPGEPAQSVRILTAVASYYLRMHSLKAQLAVSHFTELEDRTAAGNDAAFENDQMLLQVTYRME